MKEKFDYTYQKDYFQAYLENNNKDYRKSANNFKELVNNLSKLRKLYS